MTKHSVISILNNITLLHAGYAISKGCVQESRNIFTKQLHAVGFKQKQNLEDYVDAFLLFIWSNW